MKNLLFDSLFEIILSFRLISIVINEKLGLDWYIFFESFEVNKLLQFITQNSNLESG